MEKMLEKAREIKGLKKKISAEAKRVGLKCNTEDRQTTMFKVFQKIYYTKVKTLLGLDQCILFVTGAAPISREVCQLGPVHQTDVTVNTSGRELLHVAGHQADRAVRDE